MGNQRNILRQSFLREYEWKNWLSLYLEEIDLSLKMSLKMILHLRVHNLMEHIQQES